MTGSSKNILAEDVKKHFAGQLSEESMASTLKGLEQMNVALATAYSASGSLASLVLYVKAQCKIDGGKTFNGHAYGVSFPGGGALFGDVYLNNGYTLEQLYSLTVSFVFTATPVYTAFYFYDSNGHLLGNFQAGSVSTVTGTGAGPGSWS